MQGTDSTDAGYRMLREVRKPDELTFVINPETEFRIR